MPIVRMMMLPGHEIGHAQATLSQLFVLVDLE